MILAATHVDIAKGQFLAILPCGHTITTSDPVMFGENSPCTGIRYSGRCPICAKRRGRHGGYESVAHGDPDGGVRGQG